MIKNTCPNAGTPSARLAGEAETIPEAAGLAGATAALRPAASARTGTSTLPIVVRTRHPAFRAIRPAHAGQHATTMWEYPSLCQAVEAWQPGGQQAPPHHE